MGKPAGNSRATVLVSLPNTGWIHKSVVLAAMRLLGDRRHRVNVIMPTWNPYEHSMNRIAKDVLKGGHDFWLNIDADNPPENNPLDLVDLDRDICGLPTVVWCDKVPGDRPFYLNAMDAVGNEWKPHEPCEGLQEVDAVGSGCMLVARRVLEGIKPPWFVREYAPDGASVECGPDFYFCRQASSAGFSVWAHFDYPCEHHNEIPLRSAIGSIHAAIPVPAH